MTESKRYLPSAGLFPKWPQQLRLGQAKAMRQKFHQDKQEPKYMLICCLPRYIIRNLVGSQTAGTGSGTHLGCIHPKQQLKSLCHLGHPSLFLSWCITEYCVYVYVMVPLVDFA